MGGLLIIQTVLADYASAHYDRGGRKPAQTGSEAD